MNPKSSFTQTSVPASNSYVTQHLSFQWPPFLHAISTNLHTLALIHTHYRLRCDIAVCCASTQSGLQNAATLCIKIRQRDYRRPKRHIKQLTYDPYNHEQPWPSTTGVTRVDVTRGGKLWCHPIFYWKTDDLFGGRVIALWKWQPFQLSSPYHSYLPTSFIQCSF